MKSLAFFVLTLSVAVLFGCHKSEPTSSPEANAPLAPITGKITKLQDIVGYVLACETKKGPAYVYVFAPHILGIWADPVDKTLDYFVSQFVTKNGDLLYEALIVGQVNMKTTFAKPGDLKNRRIMMRLKDGKVMMMVAFGLNEKDKSPINPQQFECTRAKLISQTFDESNP